MKLDSIDWKILAALQENAREPNTALSKKVGLSAPALAERIKKMEEAGVIEGYSARISPKAAGYEMSAILRVRVAGPNIKKALAEFERNPLILDCARVTGEDCYIVKLIVRSLEGLNDAVVELASVADVTTAVVLAEPVRGKPVSRPE